MGPAKYNILEENGEGFTFCLVLNARGQKKTVSILKLTLQECPKNARKGAFFEASIFEKSAIRYPVFGVFWPIQDFETIINSHFQILEEVKIWSKKGHFRG